MKLFLASILCFVALVAAAVAVGYGPTHRHWGDEGIRSMFAVGAVCLGAAVIGALPLGVVAPRWPSYIGQAALAGTTLRLLLTGFAGLAYQSIAKPQLTSFLAWAMIFYMLLLVGETCFAVVIVHKHYRSMASAAAPTAARPDAKGATA